MGLGPHVLLTSFGEPEGDVDDRHPAMVEEIRKRLPNLAWSASWRLLGGSWDVVDAVDFQPGEEPAAVEEVVAGLGIRFELVPAQPSEWLRAPGPGLSDDVVSVFRYSAETGTIFALRVLGAPSCPGLATRRRSR